MARRPRPAAVRLAPQAPALGHRGGRILPHRAIGRLNLPMARMAGGLVLALAFTVGLLLAKPALQQAWSAQLLWWCAALNLEGSFLAAGELAVSAGPVDALSLAVPVVDLLMPEMDRGTLAWHALATVAVWVLSGWLGDALRPLCYLARFATLVHGAGVLYFLGWPASFLHSVSDHLGSGLRECWALMLLAPWMHLFTYYIFPLANWQRVALTALTLAYLALLAPLLVASHAALLALLGPVVMPLLQLVFGALLAIVGMVALYGWGMSWVDPAHAAARD